MGFDSFWVEAPQSQKDLLKPRTLLVEKGYEPRTMEVQKGNLTWNTGGGSNRAFLLSRSSTQAYMRMMTKTAHNRSRRKANQREEVRNRYQVTECKS